MITMAEPQRGVDRNMSFGDIISKERVFREDSIDNLATLDRINEESKKEENECKSPFRTGMWNTMSCNFDDSQLFDPKDAPVSQKQTRSMVSIDEADFGDDDVTFATAAFGGGQSSGENQSPQSPPTNRPDDDGAFPQACPFSPCKQVSPLPFEKSKKTLSKTIFSGGLDTLNPTPVTMVEKTPVSSFNKSNNHRLSPLRHSSALMPNMTSPTKTQSPIQPSAAFTTPARRSSIASFPIQTPKTNRTSGSSHRDSSHHHHDDDDDDDDVVPDDDGVDYGYGDSRPDSDIKAGLGKSMQSLGVESVMSMQSSDLKRNMLAAHAKQQSESRMAKLRAELAASQAQQQQQNGMSHSQSQLLELESFDGDEGSKSTASASVTERRGATRPPTALERQLQALGKPTPTPCKMRFDGGTTSTAGESSVPSTPGGGKNNKMMHFSMKAVRRQSTGGASVSSPGRTSAKPSSAAMIHATPTRRRASVHPGAGTAHPRPPHPKQLRSGSRYSHRGPTHHHNNNNNNNNNNDGRSAAAGSFVMSASPRVPRNPRRASIALGGTTKAPLSSPAKKRLSVAPASQNGAALGYGSFHAALGAGGDNVEHSPTRTRIKVKVRARTSPDKPRNAIAVNPQDLDAEMVRRLVKEHLAAKNGSGKASGNSTKRGRKSSSGRTGALMAQLPLGGDFSTTHDDESESAATEHSEMFSDADNVDVEDDEINPKFDGHASSASRWDDESVAMKSDHQLTSVRLLKRVERRVSDDGLLDMGDTREDNQHDQADIDHSDLPKPPAVEGKDGDEESEEVQTTGESAKEEHLTRQQSEETKEHNGTSANNKDDDDDDDAVLALLGSSSATIASYQTTSEKSLSEADMAQIVSIENVEASTPTKFDFKGQESQNTFASYDLGDNNDDNLSDDENLSVFDEEDESEDSSSSDSYEFSDDDDTDLADDDEAENDQTESVGYETEGTFAILKKPQAVGEDEPVSEGTFASVDGNKEVKEAAASSENASLPLVYDSDDTVASAQSTSSKGGNVKKNDEVQNLDESSKKSSKKKKKSKTKKKKKGMDENAEHDDGGDEEARKSRKKKKSKKKAKAEKDVDSGSDVEGPRDKKNKKKKKKSKSKKKKDKKLDSTEKGPEGLENEEHSESESGRESDDESEEKNLRRSDKKKKKSKSKQKGKGAEGDGKKKKKSKKSKKGAKASISEDTPPADAAENAKTVG